VVIKKLPDSPNGGGEELGWCKRVGPDEPDRALLRGDG